MLRVTGEAAGERRSTLSGWDARTDRIARILALGRGVMTRRSQTREIVGGTRRFYSKRETEAAWLRLVLSATATSRPPEGPKRHRVSTA